MAEFSVKISGLKSAVSQEATIEKELQKALESLEQVFNSSYLKGCNYDEVRNRLSQLKQSLQEQKKDMGSMKEALSQIVALYEKVEKELCAITDNKEKIEEIKSNVEELVKIFLEELFGGDDKSSVLSADPVNLSTGNLIYDHTDLCIAGEIPLRFERFYNALDEREGALGIGFIHNYEVHLEKKKGNENLLIRMESGQIKYFHRLENGCYEGERATLDKLEVVDEGFCLTTSERICYWFNEKGQLCRKENWNGRGITYTYEKESGHLICARTDNGQSLSYDYNAEGLLTSVADENNRKIYLSYEEKRLKRVQLVDGAVISYTYTEDRRIRAIENSRGIQMLKNYYDTNGRVCRQDFPDGGSMSFVYDEIRHHTMLIERNGSKIVYVQDEQFRNTDILYEDGTGEHFEYNAKNQKVRQIDRNGNVTRMSYDNRGNMTQIINALGQKVNMTYDSNNCLLKISVNGKEKFSNSYDTKGNLLCSCGADGKGSTIVYDEYGRPVQTTAADGSVTKLSYDEVGNIQRIIDGRGVETSYNYDQQNRVIRTKDGNGNVYRYEYDTSDRIVRIINPMGDSRKYSYNETGKIAKATDYDGYSVEMTYNEIDRLGTIMDKEGYITHYRYDKMWNISEVEHPDGGIHRYIYDKNNRLSEEQLAGGAHIRYSYDGNGNRTGITDAMGNETHYVFDACNRVVQVQEHNGAVTSYTYDEEGNLVTKTDALGNVTQYTYDERGRRNSKTDALGNSTSISYHISGKIERICYPNGGSIVYHYGSGGQLQQVTRQNGAIERYAYDKNGNLIEKTNGEGESIKMQYDSMNRMISKTNPLGGVCRYTYDKVGQLIKYIDELGNETAFSYSPNGNRVLVVDAMGNRKEYSYDCMRRLIREVHCGKEMELSQETVYAWDLSGNLTSRMNSLGEVEQYAYDKNNRMLSKTDREGFITRYQYDDVGKITEVLYGDAKQVKMSYNALHQLEEMTDWLGSLKVQRDCLGRPLSVTDSAGETIHYEWGCMGEKTAISYSDGTRAEYIYNDMVHLEELIVNGEHIYYEYDKIGRLNKKYLPNEVTTSYCYNGLGRLVSLEHKTNEENIESYGFSYDLAGNKIEMQKKYHNQLDMWKYKYDSLRHLTDVEKNNVLLRSYRYDSFGNRIEKVEYQQENEWITDYIYNIGNQLIQESTGNQEKRYQYDRRGNLNSIADGENILQWFYYDETNRMSVAKSNTEDGFREAHYAYNGFGQRVGQSIYRKNSQAEELTLIKDLQYTLDLTRTYHNLLSCEDKKDSRKQHYFWDGTVVSMEENNDNSYYLQDDLGSVIHLLDAGGVSLEHYDYDEFGICRQNGMVREEYMQPFQYTGYQMDITTGLYFAQARRYDAMAGRFIGEDPIHYGANWYTYASGNPLNIIDPTGLLCDDLVNKKSGNIYELIQGDYDAAPFSLELFGYWNRNYNPFYKAWAKGTQQGIFDELLAAVDFEKGSDGNYHVNTDKYQVSLFGNEYSGCWQQLGGYNIGYDFVFDIFCNMEAKNYSFNTTSGEEYTIWVWKGDYLNLGAGGECGIYYGKGWQKWAAVDDQLPMTLTVDYGDGISSTWTDETWWITSFNPYKQGIDEEDLTVTVTIDFSEASEEIWQGFYNSYYDSEDGFVIEKGSKTVTYEW